MPDVKLISKEQESRLRDSLVSAIHYANGGMSSNDALAKSANEHGLGPEFASRMVEAFNASKTVNYLKKTSAEKRAETFEIADRSEVIKRMYDMAGPKQEVSKTAAASPLRNFNRTTTCAPTLTKAASASKEDRSPVSSGLRETKVTKLYSMRDSLNKMGSDIRVELLQCKQKACEAVEKLANSFRTPGHTPFCEVEARVRSTFGDALGKKAMDIVWATTDFERLGEKRAEDVSGRLVMGTGPSYAAARELVHSLEKAAQLQSELVAYNKAVTQVSLPQPVKKAADSGIGSVVSTILPDPKEEPGSVIDPSHEAKLRSIRTKVMVNDMISNDPVLSAYAPSDVLTAYNETAKMVPGISTDPMLMRTVVSRLLQAHNRLEPHDVKTLYETEEANRKLRIKGY